MLLGYTTIISTMSVNIIAVEAAGKGIDSGESAALLPWEKSHSWSKTLLMQTHDGQITEPYSISAGLDYLIWSHAHICLEPNGQNLFRFQTKKQWTGVSPYPKWKELFPQLKQHMLLQRWMYVSLARTKLSCSIALAVEIKI